MSFDALRGTVPRTPAGAFLRHVADIGALALEKALLFEKIRTQAERDALTGLPNRSLFMQRLTDAVARGLLTHDEAGERMAAAFAAERERAVAGLLARCVAALINAGPAEPVGSAGTSPWSPRATPCSPCARRAWPRTSPGVPRRGSPRRSATSPAGYR